MRNIKTHIKKQLIQILVELLTTNETPLRNTVYKLVITGQEDIRKEVPQEGLVIDRNYLKSKHKEADPIAVAQAMYIANEEAKSVSVMANDTDIYVLLLHHYFCLDSHVPMIMESPK